MVFSFNIYKKEVIFIDPCSLNMTISALACAIAEGKSDSEINLLSAFFSQLGDSLETISAAKELNNENNNINKC